MRLEARFKLGMRENPKNLGSVRTGGLETQAMHGLREIDRRAKPALSAAAASLIGAVGPHTVTAP